MEDASTTGGASGGNRLRQSLRVLRPLLWWALLVAVLFGYRKHQLLSEATHLVFAVKLEGRGVASEATTTVDGREVESGSRVPLGRHTFLVAHPKGEPFSTNLFIWYGEHNLGDITLKRAKGILAVAANPPATLLSIRGPGFTLTLTNSGGMTSSVPSDHYQVEATFAHSKETGVVEVRPDSTSFSRFAPHVGAVELTSNQTNATFQLVGVNVRVIEVGTFPDTIRELPEGVYKLISEHHGNRQEKPLEIKSGVTNYTSAEFLYGAAAFETEPSGARVLGAEGSDWGITPLDFLELLQGPHQFILRKDGFETVAVSLLIRENETNSFRTNLVNASYLGSVNSARRFLAAGDYARAAEAAADALRVQPDDAAASALRREATGRGHLRAGESWGKQGDYRRAVLELTLALESLPENAEAQEFLADFQKREVEQGVALHKERLERVKLANDGVLARYKDAGLFESHELNVLKPASAVDAGIVASLSTVQPGQAAFKVTSHVSPEPNVFEIETEQPLFSALAQNGLRRCVIVVGQTGENETQILFKVLEYRVHYKLGIPGLINLGDAPELVPVNASRVGEMTEKLRAQLVEGVGVLTERIQRAVEGTARDGR